MMKKITDKESWEWLEFYKGAHARMKDFLIQYFEHLVETLAGEPPLLNHVHSECIYKYTNLNSKNQIENFLCIQRLER